MKRAFAPFVLDTESTFKWPVVVRVPDPDRVGQKRKTGFVAHFRHVSQERRMALLQEQRDAIKAAQQLPGDEQVEAMFNLSQRVLHEVLVRCDDVMGPDNKPVDWSDDVKGALINHQMVWPALYEAYSDALSQKDERGN